jgi:hypothetical protein
MMRCRTREALDAPFDAKSRRRPDANLHAPTMARRDSDGDRRSELGLESAAVSAASFAAAFATDATIEDVIAAVRRLAKDGTARAVDDVLAAVHPDQPLDEFIAAVRRAYLPYSGLLPQALGGVEPDPSNRHDADFAQPSRTAAVENAPVALAVLRYGRGDALRTLRTAVLYGRDCESIAAHALGLVGALRGEDSLPDALRRASERANRRNFGATGRTFAATARRILALDRERWARRIAAIDAGT